MNIRPLHDRVIVKRLEEERKTASGIVIPDTAAEKPDQGEVIAVGKGKVGDDGKIRALEVKDSPTGPAAHQSRAPQSHPPDVARESALGHALNPGGIAQARHRGLEVICLSADSSKGPNIG